MSKIKAVIFDMDGVLIEAKDWHYNALNKALDYFGMGISRYDHVTTYDGFPTKKKLEYLTLEKNLPEGLHAFINQLKQQYTVDEIMVKCKPRFIHQYALSRFKMEGYRVVVCSNSVRHSIELMLGRAALLEYCDFILSNEDVARPKPDPEMYTTAMKRLTLQPWECLVVEDNPVGLEAARRSGAHILEVGSPDDVTYHNITGRIRDIEEGGADD